MKQNIKPHAGCWWSRVASWGHKVLTHQKAGPSTPVPEGQPFQLHGKNPAPGEQQWGSLSPGTSPPLTSSPVTPPNSGGDSGNTPWSYCKVGVDQQGQETSQMDAHFQTHSWAPFLPASTSGLFPSWGSPLQQPGGSRGSAGRGVAQSIPASADIRGGQEKPTAEERPENGQKSSAGRFLLSVTLLQIWNGLLSKPES